MKKITIFFCCLSIPYCTRDHIIACTVHYHHYLFLTVLLLMSFLLLSSYNFILLLLSSLFVLLLLFVFIEKKTQFFSTECLPRFKQCEKTHSVVLGPQINPCGDAKSSLRHKIPFSSSSHHAFFLETSSSIE